ncbi:MULTISPECIES: TRAP transporter large permease [unclassified Brevibacterium]|uniref:TRAP transporter large permease n=1 Tax=unclassified Brevibacterium TaxID=2614124 RepID=UPI001E3A4F16|nr:MULTISPECIES: TRAP transporter large permease [unclassified Brevibacterium]MCD1287807.1 C4-dicarboxylate ABC transporter permease [Brevibacterium sp. CCUG 69071]MDK8435084.1 TRAP transporter large permease [Brevibacterium sp. H-BE7]
MNANTDLTGASLPPEDSSTASITGATTQKPTTALFPNGSRRERPGTLALTIGFGLVAFCLVGLFTSPSAAIGGAWCIGMMLVLLFLSVPVAIALSVPSIIGVYAVSGIPATMNILSTAPFSAVSDWSMSVLPMFIFMGMLLTQSGLSGKIYRVADHWFSWLPGGIGIGTTFAGAGLSAVTGSTIGMTYALGRAGIPEMLKAGYDRRMAVGTIMVSGMTGNLIPPSILMVVYAGIASVPVGPALMAGAVPGILLAVCFAAFIFAIGVIVPKLVGRGDNAQTTAETTDTTRPTTTWRDRFTSLTSVWGFAVILVVLFGGMFSGIFTPTEAGAAAALCSLLLCLWEKRGEQPWRKIADSAMDTVAATSAIFFIMIGATMLTSLLAITGLAPILTGLITDLGLSRIGFLLVLIVLYIVMGMFFDTLSMMLLTIPILLPTLETMGVSPLWFGVFVVLLGEFAMVTPPVGIIPYIVHSIAKNPEVNLGATVTLRDIFISLLWFLPVVVIFLILMVAMPGMTEWLPDLISRTSGGMSG